MYFLVFTYQMLPLLLILGTGCKVQSDFQFSQPSVNSVFIGFLFMQLLEDLNPLKSFAVSQVINMEGRVGPCMFLKLVASSELLVKCVKYLNLWVLPKRFQFSKVCLFFSAQEGLKLT